jgi:hypothetical protein
MFMTPIGLLAILVIHVLVGTGIAAVVVLSVLREKPTLRHLWLPTFVSTTFWLLSLHFIDLKGCDSYCQNGKRIALPWCEDQHWRVFVSAHPYWVSFCIAAIAALAAILLQNRTWKKRTL